MSHSTLIDIMGTFLTSFIEVENSTNKALWSKDINLTFFCPQQAEKYFSDMRLQEPYYFEGMEIYSTALWHLQKEVELSALAQELSDLDKNSPQVLMYLRLQCTLLFI